MAQQKRVLYWYSSMVGLLHREKESLLSQHGFEVRFFQTPELLFQELQKRRAGVIIVGDEGAEDSVVNVIRTLMNEPDIQGARLLLSVINRHPKAMQMAACGTFRDIIPLNIENKSWLQRFSYATASRPIPMQMPYPQVCINNVASIALPARIVWLSANQMWIESRARPPKGATLHLRGPIAEALGVPHLVMTVEENHRSRLRYRFSDAIVATWGAPEAIQARTKTLLNQLKDDGVGPRYRVFVAMQTAALRRRLTTKLDAMQFEVGTALQKQAIVDEPKFFSPDIVFIESLLCREADRLDQLLKNLASSTPVVVIGDFPELDTYKRRFPQHRLFGLADVPGNLPQLVFTSYLSDSVRANDTAGQASACHISSTNPLSLAEVVLPARLTQIHPLAAQISLPFPVGNFALMKIESPVLTRITEKHPFCKIAACYESSRPGTEAFPWIAEGFLSDLDEKYTQRLAQALSLLVAEQLGVRGTTGLSQERQVLPPAAPPKPSPLESLSPKEVSAPAIAIPAPVITPTSEPEYTPRPRPKPKRKNDKPLFDGQFVLGSIIIAALCGVFAALLWWVQVKGPFNEGNAEEISNSFCKLAPHRCKNNDDNKNP